MPVTPYLKGQSFDAETRRVLGVALELVCVALRTGDCDDNVKQCITNKLIELAVDGERNLTCCAKEHGSVQNLSHFRFD